MDVQGQCDLKISTADDQNKNTKTILSRAIVANSVSHPALISWHDLQSLGIISSQFPTSCAVHDLNGMKDKLFAKFPEVFRDSLLPDPMVGDPVSIKLKEDAVPFRMSVARQIPLRFEEPANKVIQGLIDNNVITPCHEPTDWCAPGFFLVKADGKSVRLVTDYTKLNSYVKLNTIKTIQPNLYSSSQSKFH